MKYDFPNGWTCVACGDEYVKDTKGKQVADYSEGTMCKKCKEESKTVNLVPVPVSKGNGFFSL